MLYWQSWILIRIAAFWSAWTSSFSRYSVCIKPCRRLLKYWNCLKRDYSFKIWSPFHLSHLRYIIGILYGQQLPPSDNFCFASYMLALTLVNSSHGAQNMSGHLNLECFWHLHIHRQSSLIVGCTRRVENVTLSTATVPFIVIFSYSWLPCLTLPLTLSYNCHHRSPPRPRTSSYT